MKKVKELEEGYYIVKREAYNEPEVALYKNGMWYFISFFPTSDGTDIEEISLPVVKRQTRFRCWWDGFIWGLLGATIASVLYYLTTKKNN